MSKYRPYRKYKKDNCEICGVSGDEPVTISRGMTYRGLSVHHFIPTRVGGSNEPDNLITLCEKCHREKHTVNGKLDWYSITSKPTFRAFVDSH